MATKHYRLPGCGARELAYSILAQWESVAAVDNANAMPDVSRELGNLSARMDGVDSKLVDHISKSDLWRKEFGEKLDRVINHENERKGAVRLLMFIAKSSIGALFVTWLAAKLGVKIPEFGP